MAVFIYVKTKDEPQSVGEIVCKANSFEDQHPEDRISWIMKCIKGTWTPIVSVASIPLIPIFFSDLKKINDLLEKANLSVGDSLASKGV